MGPGNWMLQARRLQLIEGSSAGGEVMGSRLLPSTAEVTRCEGWWPHTDRQHSNHSTSLSTAISAAPPTHQDLLCSEPGKEELSLSIIHQAMHWENGMCWAYVAGGGGGEHPWEGAKENPCWRGDPARSQWCAFRSHCPSASNRG